jgi:serine/threonine protein kinase/Tol biopolymer transport system component
MPLAAGTKLGPYEIQSAIGAGGMGEVYRARDTRLDRVVAIKILPAALAADPQFRERFDREARTISQLNHPHICTLYDVGHENATDFLVMEFLDGETLEKRIEKGPLTIDDALQIAVQMASALDTAHRAGIVHRDLKPGNIILTRGGSLPSRAEDAARDRRPSAGGGAYAKLLDFGLAKIAAPTIVVAGASMLATTPPLDDGRGRTGDPTRGPALTAQGTILGTFQYMAPEQIEGQEADARTDIFAFGAVLYEMFTGRKAFEGKTRASLLGAILKDEPPPISRDQPLAPASLNRIVATCLAKEPEDRWQTMRDLLRELKWVVDGTAASETTSTVASASSSRASVSGVRRVLPWAATAALAAAVVVMLVLWAPWRTIPAVAPLRLSTELGADVTLTTSPAGGPGASLALSPDGTLLVFVAHKTAAGSQLYIRRLGQLQATPLSGTDGARDPFFSPEGQWIAFFAGGQLKKISVTGGAAVSLCATTNNDRGGAWGEDGTIVFTTSSGGGGVASALLRVSSAGGKPEPLTTLVEGEVTHRWPQMLPGDKAVLYTASGNLDSYDDANIVVQTLPAGARKVLQRGGYYGRYVPSGSGSPTRAGSARGLAPLKRFQRESGHLVYVHDGTLFAAPFDLDRLEVTGQPVPALEGVTVAPSSAGAEFALSGTGTLVYLPGQSVGDAAPVFWMDHTGETTPLLATPKNWTNPSFAPDGRRLALEIFDGKEIDVWVYDLARDTLSRLTFDPASDQKPVWTPDGRRIVFGSARADKATFNLYWQQADGSTSEAQRLTDSKNQQFPASWHPSAKYLAFYETNPQTSDDLMILPMEGDEASGWKPGKPTVFLNTAAVEREPMFSPDGRWIAYQSNESGQTEVFVRPFPGPGGRWQISAGGGSWPTWSRTRHELLYRTADNRIVVAPYTVEGDSFKADKTRLWSDRAILPRLRSRFFALHPDGNRFAAAVATDSQPEAKQDHVTFIFNFFDELRRIAGPR